MAHHRNVLLHDKFPPTTRPDQLVGEGLTLTDAIKPSAASHTLSYNVRAKTVRREPQVSRLLTLLNTWDDGFHHHQQSEFTACQKQPGRDRLRSRRGPKSKATLPHGNLTACFSVIPYDSVLYQPTTRAGKKATSWTPNCHHKAAFVLEYCDGGTLSDYVAAQKAPLPARVASALLFPILLGLDHLHNVLHTMHRDIKPANILLCQEDSGVNQRPPFINSELWRVKLADFGISKTTDQAKTFCGTSTYMAPEVDRPRSSRQPLRYGYSADIYSLGCVLKFMLCRGNPAAMNKSGKPPVSWALETSEPPLPDCWVVSSDVMCGCSEEKVDAVDCGQCSKCGKCTPCAIHLCNWMTNKDPSRRPTIQQIFTHPFIMGNLSFRFVGLQEQVLWERFTLSSRSALSRNTTVRRGRTKQGRATMEIVCASRRRFKQSKRKSLRGFRHFSAVIETKKSRSRTLLSLFPGHIFEPTSLSFLAALPHCWGTASSYIREKYKPAIEVAEQPLLTAAPLPTVYEPIAAAVLSYAKEATFDSSGSTRRIQATTSQRRSEDKKKEKEQERQREKERERQLQMEREKEQERERRKDKAPTLNSSTALLFLSVFGGVPPETNRK